MRRKKIWVVTLMAFMVLALPALAQKGKKPKKGKIPVTVTFRDCTSGVSTVEDPAKPSVNFDCPTLDHTGAPTVTHDDRIKSDSKGTYTDNANITSSSGKFRFGLPKPWPNKPAKRELFLDFSDCDSGPCIKPFNAGLVGAAGAVNFHTKGIDLREIAVGDFRDDLGLAVGFDLNSIGEGIWTLRFNFDFADCPEVPATSSPLTVTRTTAVTYEIEAAPSDLACLGLGEGGHFIFKGLYRMPFLISLVCIDETQCVAP